MQHPHRPLQPPVQQRFLTLMLAGALGLGGCGGGAAPVAAAPGNPEVPAPTAPSVSAVAPANIVAGAAATLLTISGSGFTGATVIEINTVAAATAFVSTTQVTAAATAQQLSGAGVLTITAVNGTLASISSSPVTLEVDNPAPAISQLSPAGSIAGAAAGTLTVTGTGFVPATSIYVNGAIRAASYVSATQMTTGLTASDQALAGTLAVTAFNPAPGGGSSAAGAGATFTVANSPPGGLTLVPDSLLAGAPVAATVTVTGTNFAPGASLQVNGVVQAATTLGATLLTFAASVAEQATAAKLAITVVNPGPGGGASPPATLTITALTPTPVAEQVSPAQILAGSGPTQLTVMGVGLALGQTLQWNGTALPTIFVGGTIPALLATVPAAMLATATNASVGVFSPTSRPSVFSTVTVAVVNPPAPVLGLASVVAVPMNSDATISLAGSDFSPTSVVLWNGASVATSYNAATQLSAVIPAALLAQPGIGTLKVSTPAPGGGVSAALPLTVYLGLANNDMAYNPVNGLLYLSVPSSAGPVYGNSVVSVDPANGALGTPMPVGSEPDQLALTADGRSLWVALDGAGSVRKLELATGALGPAFPIPRAYALSGGYAAPLPAGALLAAPGMSDGVIVGALSHVGLFNSGALVGALSAYGSGVLVANPALGEIYSAGNDDGYEVYTFSTSGTALKSGNASTTVGAEMQLAGGVLYTDAGKTYDPETGASEGSFYVAGTTLATGAAFADAGSDTMLILDATSLNGWPNQIQLFDLNTDANRATLPIGIAGMVSNQTAATRLRRWDVNGLAFRTASGVYSLRSNLVSDLSAVNADLGVSLATAGNDLTGATLTYSALVTNVGPAPASAVVLTAQPPAGAIIQTVAASTGATCAINAAISCDLGALASGGSVTVNFQVVPTAAGVATLAAQVTAAENDPAPGNNQASLSATITGADFNPVPVLLGLSPNAVRAGTDATPVTVTGAGFTRASSILLDGTPIATQWLSATQLSATVPAARLATMGWAGICVATTAPGGGNSATLPLTIYTVVALGANHIVYDPFSRQIMASINSASTVLVGNAIVALTPDTGALDAPVVIGSQPENLSLTDDGNILYAALTGNQSIGRFNMLTRQTDFTFPLPAPPLYDPMNALRGVAAQPGTENTIVADLGEINGNVIVDVDPVAQTGVVRGSNSGSYSGSCDIFLDADDLLAYDIDDPWGGLDHYTVTASGFSGSSSYEATSLNGFGCFQLSGGVAFGNGGGVANPALEPAAQLGQFASVATAPKVISSPVAADVSLQRAFYLERLGTTNTDTPPSALVAYDTNSYLETGVIPIDFAAVEANTGLTGVDLVRWGQDGLAILSSGGDVYLLRGPAVAPQELNQNTAAILLASANPKLAVNGGNTLLTLTGENFVPGVAVSWNGSYRTTTVVDATHLTVALSASDLTAAGSGELVATNPGAPPSSVMTITIQ